VLIHPNHSKLRYNGALRTVATEAVAELDRYSEDYYLNGMDGTVNLSKARTQPGVSISFKTDSPLVTLMFSEREDTAIRGRRFTIFRNGEVAYDRVRDLEFTIANPSKETVEWEVYLPTFSGVTFLGLKLSPEYTLHDLPADDTPLYVAIGNSITHGVGQSGTLDTYAYRVADALGLRHINLATGGSRISAETLRNFNDISPRLVTILWGYNDVNQSRPVQEAVASYETLVRGLCTKFPDAEVYSILQTFTTTVVGRRNEDNRIDLLRELTRESVSRLQEAHSNLYLMDGAKYVTSEDDLKDKVHLNPQGARKLAEGIVAEYRANENRSK
jgi:lysophospholipase L1-like esterase